MPIKPENRSRYPKNWPEIRASILGRANNQCEFCKAKNHHIIVRGTGVHQDTYLTHDEQIFCAKTGRELTGICASAADYENTGKAIKVVLTIAHMGLPAHLPVFLHVTRSTEADKIFKIIGIIMPLNPEFPKWHFMMHGRALTEFKRGSTTVSTPFFIALPCRQSSCIPRGAVTHQTLTMPPQYITITNWCLLGEPVKSALITTKSAALLDIPSAYMECFSTALADTLTNATLANAQLFIATGCGAGFDFIGSLLGGNLKSNSTNSAVLSSLASTLCAPNTWLFDSNANIGVEQGSTCLRTSFSRLSGIVDECDTATSTINGFGRSSWSGHTKLYHMAQYPENNDPANLRALCQKCHNDYDREHRQRNALITRQSKRNGGAKLELESK